jgi:hypothetical protein
LKSDIFAILRFFVPDFLDIFYDIYFDYWDE